MQASTYFGRALWNTNNLGEFMTALGAVNAFANTFFTSNLPPDYFLTTGDGSSGSFLSQADF